MRINPAFNASALLVTAVVAAHGLFHGCKARSVSDQRAGNSTASDAPVHVAGPLSSTRSEAELTAAFREVLARYKKMPAPSYNTSATAKSLRPKRKMKTLNIRLRGSVSKLGVTAKMTGSANLGAPIRASGGVIKKELLAANAVNVEFPQATDERYLAAVMEFLRADDRIDLVEPDYTVSAIRQPDDPRLPELWGMSNSIPGVDIRAINAWDQTTGSLSVVVGVIDSGIDCTHEDLVANCWTNPGESGVDNQGRDKRTNGFDDDGNGFVDDWRGWNFHDNNNNASDDNNHGTHVAGTIGGRGNNALGVVGVNWQVSLVPLKFLGADGTGYISDAMLALDYATRMGFFATNNSWGGGGYSSLMESAIRRANSAGSLFVAAAGNEQNDNDRNPSYPASYVVPNVISVSAIDQAGNLAWFSNYGARSVAVAAPGVDIMSTLPGNRYGRFNGTSMAAPHATGILALMKARDPGATGISLLSRLLDSVNTRQSLAGRVRTGGLVNAVGALNASPDITAPSAPTGIDISRRATTSALLAWTPAGDDGINGTAVLHEVRISPNRITNIAEWNSAREIPVNIRIESGKMLADMTGLPAGFDGWLAMRGTDESGNASPVSENVELKLVPMRLAQSHDGTTMSDIVPGTPWIMEDDPVRGRVYSDGPGTYRPNSRRRMSLREIPLTGVQHAALTYWSRTAIETIWDNGKVLVSYPGLAESMWREVDNVTGQSGWEERSVDLSQFISHAVGQGATTIQLHFDLVTDESVEYEGWLVDDIKVKVNDSLVSLSGVPDGTMPPGSSQIQIAGPVGTLYTSQLIQGTDPVHADCSIDTTYTTPVPQTPISETLTIDTNQLQHKFLCIRTTVPGYAGYVHNWASWHLIDPSVQVTGTGFPTGESNQRTFTLAVMQPAPGNIQDYTYALTSRPVGVDTSSACRSSNLIWSPWTPIEQGSRIDVYAVLQGMDADVALCVRGRSPTGAVQTTPSAYGWRADFTAPDLTLDANIPQFTREATHVVRVSGPSDLSVCGIVVVGGDVACPSDPAAYAPCVLAPQTQQITALAEGPHKLCATGADRAGNTMTTPREMMWTRDITPPVATLTGTPPASTRFPTGTIRVSGDGVVSYQFATGRLIESCANWSPRVDVTVPVNLALVTDGDGPRVLCVKAMDAAGNEPESPVILSWIQDTLVRSLAFGGLPDLLSNARSLNVSINTDENGTYRHAITSGRSCNTTSLARAIARPVTEKIIFNLPLSDGAYTICASFTDAAGNTQATPTTFTWTKDTAPPVAAIRPAPPTRTAQPQVEFSVTGTGVVDYQWASLDRPNSCVNATYGPFVPVANKTTFNAGTPGDKLLCVRGRDGAGNIQANAAAHQWTLIPPAPPQLNVLSGIPFSPAGKSDWTIVVGGDRVTEWQYALMNSQTTNCTGARYGAFNPATLNGASNPIRLNDGGGNGYRTLCMRAKDSFGLIQTTPTVLRWLKFTGAPLVEPTTTFGTLSRQSPAGTTENLTLQRNNGTNVAEIINVRMCLVSTSNGLLGSCKAGTVTFSAGESSKSFRFTSVGAGNWIVLALPPQARGRVEPMPVRK